MKEIGAIDRSFSTDNILVVHKDRYNAALNIAYEIALCYDPDLECYKKKKCKRLYMAYF
ncbi:hypothetical protein [Ruminococcus sp.]|jgi:hypothetical protein|uniref:hypothetical protein n=1 Tax=Ruminococcus sp. TaxID=41978 RepID=UPI0025E55DB7|nr:hypothetical protein [Ruminococcus sp.]